MEKLSQRQEDMLAMSKAITNCIRELVELEFGRLFNESEASYLKTVADRTIDRYTINYKGM